MTERRTIKINFTDFWLPFDKTNNFFYNLLIKNYEVVISDKPDFLFYFSKNGVNHQKFNCTKILFTGENERPDFRFTDFAFSYDYSTDNRNYRLPLYALYGDMKKLNERKIDVKKILESKKKFCCFLVSNSNGVVRNEFFKNLCKYKQVDSGGSVYNNIGKLVQDKSEFIKDYKFVIAFENDSYPGYTSEKVFEPLRENCVPIYWGNPLVDRDFSTKSFINCHEYPSFDHAIRRVIEVDQNDELYLRYLSEPAFTDQKINEFVDEENILRQLDTIVAYHFNGKFKWRRILRPGYFVLNATKEAVIKKMVVAKRLLKKIINALFNR